MPTSGLLHRRILVTLALLAAYRLGLHIPLPGMDPSVLSRLPRPDPESALLGGWIHPQMSFFGLGIAPYFSAAVIVLLLSGLILPLRGLRDGHERSRHRFDQVILIATVLIALVQSYGMSIYICNALGPLRMGLTLPPEAFQLVATLGMTIGTLVLIWFGHLITRYGVGNGIALLLVSGLIGRLLPTILREIRIASVVGQPRGYFILPVLLFAATLAAVCAFLHTHLPER